MKNRIAVAFLLAGALAIGHHDAEAGKGRTARSAKVVRTERGLVYRERIVHSKGVRARLTGGLLGRVMTVTREQGAGVAGSEVKRGRRRVVKETHQDGRGGTVSGSRYEKKGLLTRIRRTRMTRVDEVGPSRIEEQSTKNRFFGQSVHLATDRTTGLMDDSQVTVSKVRKDGTIKNQRYGRSGGDGHAWRGELKGRRQIERNTQGMAIEDTQQRRWGLWARLSFGRLGKKKTMKVSEVQRTDGTVLTVETPRGTRTVRETQVNGDRTVSFGRHERRGRLRERDMVTVTPDKAVQRTEVLRRNGTVKRVVTEKTFADGSTRKKVERRRRNGSVKSVSIKASRRNAQGKREWLRSRRSYGRNGEARFGFDIGKAGGGRAAHVTTPLGTVGTQRHLRSNSTSGRIESSTPAGH